jgi:NitT/TauT family transport system ATP-binding protein
MSLAPLNLPDYREKSPEVAARFKKISQRPVVLSVRNLHKSFETQDGPKVAFEPMSLDVHRREFICIIGPSGCGKSTLIRIVAGLEGASGGEILIDDHPVSGPGPDRGMVFQGYTLFPWRTVKQNIMFGMEMRGKARTNADVEARQWLDMVGLSKFEKAYPHELRILLMDEPFGALDALTRCKMQNYLLQIWKKVEVTILFITHDLEEACFLADRIIVMGANPGRVLEVIENPIPRPRSTAQLLSPEFIALKHRLDELIHGSAAAEAEEDRLPMIKLTEAGDEVE